MSVNIATVLNNQKKKTFTSVKKIEKLIDKIDKDFFKKLLNNPNEKIGVISNMKKFYEIYCLCLIELCEELCFFDLDFLGISFIKLFHSFKMQTMAFMKINLEFFLQQNLNFEKEKILQRQSFIEREKEIIKHFSIDAPILMKRLDISNSDKKETNFYEYVEKADFYLKKEIAEVNELLEESANTKKEIELALLNAKKINQVRHSNVTKELEEVFKVISKSGNNFENILLKSEKHNNNSVAIENKKEYYHDLVDGLMSRVFSTQKNMMGSLMNQIRRDKKSKKENQKNQFVQVDPNDFDEQSNNNYLVAKNKFINARTSTMYFRVENVSDNISMNEREKNDLKCTIKVLETENQVIKEKIEKNDFRIFKKKKKIAKLKDEVKFYKQRVTDLQSSNSELLYKSKKTAADNQYIYSSKQGELQREVNIIKDDNKFKTEELKNKELEILSLQKRNTNLFDIIENLKIEKLISEIEFQKIEKSDISVQKNIKNRVNSQKKIRSNSENDTDLLEGKNYETYESLPNIPEDIENIKENNVKSPKDKKGKKFPTRNTKSVYIPNEKKKTSRPSQIKSEEKKARNNEKTNIKKFSRSEIKNKKESTANNSFLNNEEIDKKDIDLKKQVSFEQKLEKKESNNRSSEKSVENNNLEKNSEKNLEKIIENKKKIKFSLNLNNETFKKKENEISSDEISNYSNKSQRNSIDNFPIMSNDGKRQSIAKRSSVFKDKRQSSLQLKNKNSIFKQTNNLENKVNCEVQTQTFWENIEIGIQTEKKLVMEKELVVLERERKNSTDFILIAEQKQRIIELELNVRNFEDQIELLDKELKIAKHEKQFIELDYETQKKEEEAKLYYQHKTQEKEEKLRKMSIDQIEQEKNELIEEIQELKQIIKEKEEEEEKREKDKERKKIEKEKKKNQAIEIPKEQQIEIFKRHSHMLSQRESLRLFVGKLSMAYDDTKLVEGIIEFLTKKKLENKSLIFDILEWLMINNELSEKLKFIMDVTNCKSEHSKKIIVELIEKYNLKHYIFKKFNPQVFEKAIQTITITKNEIGLQTNLIISEKEKLFENKDSFLQTTTKSSDKKSFNSERQSIENYYFKKGQVKNDSTNFIKHTHSISLSETFDLPSRNIIENKKKKNFALIPKNLKIASNHNSFSMSEDYFNLNNNNSSQISMNSIKSLYLNVDKSYAIRKKKKEFSLLKTEDILETDEEQTDNSLIVKQIFDHVEKVKSKDVKNYSKIKSYFKFNFNTNFRYPFKSIYENYAEEKAATSLSSHRLLDASDEENIGYNDIKKFYKKIVKIHKKCGKKCKHLKRFYERIGFEKKASTPEKIKKRTEIEMNKIILNKLPKIIS